MRISVQHMLLDDEDTLMRECNERRVRSGPVRRFVGGLVGGLGDRDIEGPYWEGYQVYEWASGRTSGCDSERAAGENVRQ